jgi:hypothetical protein
MTVYQGLCSAVGIQRPVSKADGAVANRGGREGQREREREREKMGFKASDCGKWCASAPDPSPLPVFGVVTSIP